MGRYYEGDIKGKFWFGVQTSNCADRFGSKGTPHHELDYYFDDDHLEDVEQEIQNIKNTIGLENIVKLDTFFKEVDSYSDETLAKLGLLEIYKKYIKNI